MIKVRITRGCVIRPGLNGIEGKEYSVTKAEYKILVGTNHAEPVKPDKPRDRQPVLPPQEKPGQQPPAVDKPAELELGDVVDESLAPTPETVQPAAEKPQPPSGATVDELDDMKYTELKSMAKDMNLNTSGNTAALIARIRDARASDKE